MKRNNALDIAKGIGIVLMIVGHMTGMIPLHKFIYQFHMPMFLMFSGYFFDAQKWNSFLAFVTKRFKQLIVPYICFAVVIILVSSMILESDYNLMLTLSQGIPHAIWYLLILFFVEILFFGLNKINNGISFLGVSILVLALMGQILYWTNIKCPYSLSAIPVCTVFYILGFMFRKIAVKIPPPLTPEKSSNS